MMENDIYSEIDKDKFRKRLSRFTWQAYHQIPPINAPVILDIGCGSGIPTIDLAVLCKGKIIALDNNGGVLKRLKEKVKALHLSGHIKPVKGSLHKLRFKKEYFDIIWAEGSIAVIGFEQGLEKWYKYIKPKGFLVIHDEIKGYQQKMNLLSRYHYTLVKHFKISEYVWEEEYFKPLEKRINELRNIYKHKPEILRILDQEACEIDQFKQSPKDFASVFYIMQKN